MPSIRKKTTKNGRDFYEIRVSRGRGKSYLSTRWYVPDGWSRRSIEKELAKQAAEFERKVHSGEVTSKAEQKEAALLEEKRAESLQTLKNYSERVFMPSIAIRCSENTRNAYQSNLDNWILPAIGEMKMPDIKAAHIASVLLDMQSKGRAQATCVKVYTVLHSLFRMAYMEDVISSNPMDKVERPRPRKDEVKSSEADAYTVEEVQKILDGLAKEPIHWQVYMRLMIDTGIRRGEAGALKWENINFEDNTITIAGNLCYTPQKGTYLDTPKNGKTRTIDVDPAVMKLLKEYKAEQKIRSDYVFTQQDSALPMHPHSPTRFMKRFAKKYGISGLHPHKLRHTFASIAITYGADVASVSEKLGHSDKAVTLRMYTHADAESMKRASNVFRSAISRKSEKNSGG